MISQNKTKQNSSMLSTDANDTNVVDETVMDLSTDGILCENTSLGCSSNKKRKIELEWSWNLLIKEIKSDKEDQDLFTWSLIIQQMIQNNWNLIPKTYQIAIIEYLIKKIDEIEASDFQNKKNANNSSKKIDLVYFKNIYFNTFYLVLKNVSTNNHDLITKLNKEVVNKTIDFYYKQLNMNQSSYFTILIDIVNLSHFFTNETNYFKLIIEKFLTLLPTTDVFEVDSQFLKLVLTIINHPELNKKLLNETLRVTLIETILQQTKIQKNTKETENDTENMSFTAIKARDKMNSSLTQSFFEAKSKASLIKLKNFNENSQLISNILLSLTGVFVINKSSSNEDLIILKELSNQNETTRTEALEAIEAYYNKMTDLNLNPKKKETNKTTTVVNMKLCKLVIEKLSERSKEMCQPIDFNLQCDTSSADFSNLNKNLIDEYFLQLNFSSNIMNDEIDLNHLIKKVKNLSILITMNFKKLLKCLSQTDLPIIEKKNILNQLNYILTEISFNFQSNVCTNEAKLYIFLCTFDFKLIETILQLIALNEDLFKEETNKNETKQYI